MRTEIIALSGAAPGTRHELTVLRFGEAGARPKAYIQAGLHADESPGHLAAHHLRERLALLEAEGALTGEVVLVPSANPLGLTQTLNGTHHGRFSLTDGGNFNRGYAPLTDALDAAVASRLTRDAGTNTALIRAAMAGVVAARPAYGPVESLKRALLSLAADADIVLDLHCDGEALVHLYTLTPQAEAFAPLAALLGARAFLTASNSGGDPFDEALSRPWVELQSRHPDKPIPMACLVATLELRGEADVSHEFAARDAGAILDFLRLKGVLARQSAPLADAADTLPACPATPLEGTEPLIAPVSGIVVYRSALGSEIAAGDVVADLVDPVSGDVTPVAATTSGILFARAATRYAHAGKRLGKIAGETPLRSGALLSP